MAIQWNKVTWYSKLIALVLFVALPFIGFWYGTQYGELIAPLAASSTPQIVGSLTPTSTSDYYSNISEWQTDSNNTSGGFSIAYPLDFPTMDNYSVAPSTDWRLNSNASGIKYFTLTIPSAFEPDTNFVDATLTVGASADQQAIAECLTSDVGDGPATATSSVTINGIQFTIFKSDGAAAGNYYETTSYRTLHAGECYAVEYTIHSGQIENYPAAYNLQPVNETQLTNVLDRIVDTFKFM